MVGFFPKVSSLATIPPMARGLLAQVQTCKKSGSDILNLAMTLHWWLGDIHPCREKCPTALLGLPRHPHTHQLHFKSWPILPVVLVATETCRCFLHHHTLFFFLCICTHAKQKALSLFLASVLFPLFPRYLVCHTAACLPLHCPVCGHTSLESQARGALKVMHMPLYTSQG